MIIDALDILHARSVDIFMLVTSDSDFTALATRIREDGFGVVGVGRTTAPPSFVKGCDQFLLIESILPSTENEQLLPSQKRSDLLGKEGPTSSELKAQGRDLLTRAANQTANPDGVVLGASLGIVLKRMDPSFVPSSYGVRKLADFIKLFPGVLVPTGKKSGVDPSYKIVSK